MNPALNAARLLALLVPACALAAPDPHQTMIDKRFGSHGRALVAFDQGGDLRDEANAIGEQSDGRIVVAGTIDLDGGRSGIGVARRLRNGAQDPSFGTGGQRVIAFPGVSIGAEALAIQADDKIVIAGWWADGDSGGLDYLVIRLNADGSDLDGSFGLFGLHVEAWDMGGNNFDAASSVAVQDDGKIVVVGVIQRNVPTDRDIGVIRLNTNGTLDLGFGSNGRRIVFPDLGGGNDDRALSVALQGDGKIVIGGSTTNSNGDMDFLAARLLANGNLDPNFANGGIGNYHIITGSCFDDVAMTIVPVSWGLITPERRLLLAGMTCVDVGGIDDWDFAVVRLLENGQLDTSFDNTGHRVIPVDLGGPNRDIVTAMRTWKEDPLGMGFLFPPTHITLGGYALDTRAPGDRGYQFAFAQLKWNGSYDTQFGFHGRGYVDFDLGANNNDYAEAMMLTARGEAVAAGTVRRAAGDDQDFGLTRIVLDRIFAGDQEND